MFFSVQNYKHDNTAPLHTTATLLPDNFVLQNVGPIKKKRRKQASAAFRLDLDQPFMLSVANKACNNSFSTGSSSWSSTSTFFESTFSSIPETPSRHSHWSHDLSYRDLSIPETPPLDSRFSGNWSPMTPVTPELISDVTNSPESIINSPDFTMAPPPLPPQQKHISVVSKTQTALAKLRTITF
ncbi:hypothetical protein BDP27DRAFT_1426382 [Rhodocollybia butyracea]|uniref:Uncharacterized protein n=1 Tax=Rhodocollybia butyracea TaxID=206335 RepID=A0A9P5PJT4_9AGAR|nr:hypothetical protein BDP27DRAFT_1426382 [Rhodocollybia butyracea]